MPEINLLLLDNTTVLNTKNIPEGRPNILIFFSPYCKHCQAETESILSKIDSLQGVHFYFLTLDPMYDMRAFNGYYKLFKYSNITVGRDYFATFPGKFPKALPPYSLVYDKYNRLRAVFAGETKASELISFINTL